MTDYVVLHYIDHENTWARVAQGAESEFEIKARSAKAAIQHWLEGNTLGGTFVAVPARSWKPVTVEVETKTALKFS